MTQESYDQHRKIPFSFTLGDALTVSYFTLLLYVIIFFTDTTYKSYFNIPVYYSEFTLDYYLGTNIMIPILMIVIVATIWSSRIQDGLLISMRQATLLDDRRLKIAKAIMSTIYRYVILYSLARMFELVGETKYITYVFSLFWFEFFILPLLTAFVYYLYKLSIKSKSMIKRKSFSNPYQPLKRSWKFRWRQFKQLYIRIIKEQRTIFELHRFFSGTIQMLLIIVGLSLIMFFFAYQHGFYIARHQTHFYTIKLKKEKWVILATYEDSLIAAPLKNKEIDAQFRLVDRKSKEALEANYEKVGPLKVKGKIASQEPIYHYLR